MTKTMGPLALRAPRPMYRLNPGADPGFKVRGGALEKIAPSGGKREICWGISCEKS